MKITLPAIYMYLIIILAGLSSLEAQSLNNEVNYSSHKYLPGYGFRKMSDPEIFQGNMKRKKYFEGWYFKMVSSNGSSILSVIPGISISQNGDEQHAFIQIIDGVTAETYYYTFPIEEFAFSKKEFSIRIGENYFSQDSIKLKIHNDSSDVSGEIYMSQQVKLPPKKILNSGIMGWYRFVPFMQCYHGLISMNHRLEGRLTRDGISYYFNNGTGYIEKDWGQSMPSAWIWIQSNNFIAENSSFMLSVANIPWMGKSFTGFLGFLLHEGTIYRFATYTHADLQLATLGQDTVQIIITDKKIKYLIEASRTKTGLLKAPVKGSMDRRIPESIDANLRISVMDHKGNLILSDSTSIAGLEIVGDLDILTSLTNRKNKPGH